MMKKTVNIILSFVILVGGILVLKFFFDAPNYVIAGILIIGFLGGTVIKIMSGYLKPSQRFFRFRFVFYGIGAGIIIGLISLIMDYEEKRILAFNELILKSGISIFFGIAVFTSMLHSGLKKFRKKIGLKKSDPALCDYATYIHPTGKRMAGYLLLTEASLMFYTRKTLERLFTVELKDIKPGIRRAKITGIPIGINLQENDHSIFIAFPHYWIERIYEK